MAASPDPPIRGGRSSADIRKKIKRAVTDSGAQVKAGQDKPALTNLLELYAGVTGDQVPEIEPRYAGKGYGDLKADLADLVVEHLEPMQEHHAELLADEPHILDILEDGRKKASAIADKKLSLVKQVLGLL